ncbi:MAG TPA: hypothetical protein VJU16_02470 [Planctomycetota bacterium]|nr:hypothetical protein [Planctomycetota bacterium]
MRSLCAAALLLFLPASSAPSVVPQDAKEAADKEFQKKVDAAIDKGFRWMLDKYRSGLPEPKKSELICLTLAHSGLRADHPFLVQQVNRILGRPLSETYNAGLLALLMEKLDRRQFQGALAETALYFVDSQCANGQWAYNGKLRRLRAQYAPAPSKRKDDGLDPNATRADDDGIAPGKPIKIPAQAKASGFHGGDNSNSQYAILGLFAAARANCDLPRETLEKSVKWWESAQNSDGGWGYQSAETPGFSGDEWVTNDSTGSMTTAGLTALIVCKFYLGQDPKADPKVQKGLKWLGENLAFSKNPGTESALWHYYYLYGLERVGQISELKEIGGKDWYRGGATWLIENQKSDGRWESAGKGDALNDDVCNTCFAILFLRRATPSLKRLKDVVTGDSRKKKE